MTAKKVTRKPRVRAVPRSKAKNGYELLNDVIKAIQAEPRRFNMYDWVRANAGKHLTDGKLWIGNRQQEPPACGTIACVAGWVCLLKRGPGQKAVDLDLDYSFESRTYDLLFGEGPYDPVNPDYSRYWGAQAALKQIIFSDSNEDPGTKAYVDVFVRKLRAFQKGHSAILKARTIENMGPHNVTLKGSE